MTLCDYSEKGEFNFYSGFHEDMEFEMSLENRKDFVKWTLWG